MTVDDPEESDDGLDLENMPEDIRVSALAQADIPNCRAGACRRSGRGLGGEIRADFADYQAANLPG
jgi:hypothetical protein